MDFKIFPRGLFGSTNTVSFVMIVVVDISGGELVVRDWRENDSNGFEFEFEFDFVKEI